MARSPTPFLFAAALAAACEPADEQMAWAGERVTLTTVDDVEPCGGTLPFLDRFAEHNYAYWTTTLLPDDFAAEIELRRGAPSEGIGAAHSATGSAWVSAQAGLLHELTHLVWPTDPALPFSATIEAR